MNHRFLNAFFKDFLHISILIARKKVLNLTWRSLCMAYQLLIYQISFSYLEQEHGFCLRISLSSQTWGCEEVINPDLSNPGKQNGSSVVQIMFYWNTFMPFLCIYLWLFVRYIGRMEWLQQRLCFLRSLKYSLSEPLQKSILPTG